MSEEATCEGIQAEYDVAIDGNFSEYRLDFGDGQFTNVVTSGTHTYAPATIIDPVVVVGNPNCQIIQTPPQRLNPTIVSLLQCIVVRLLNHRQ